MLIDEKTVSIPVLHENAKGDVNENGCRKIPQANQEGSDNGTGVVIVPENDHVVNAVGKARENGELDNR
jgi:hypothetical protein